MYAGVFSGFVTAEMNRSTRSGAGDATLNGTLTKFSPAALAAAASWSISAPGSLASRTLMIARNPICLMAGTASALVAPPHATVVSSRAKLVMPGIVSLVTFEAWAKIVVQNSVRAIAKNARGRVIKADLRLEIVA